MMVLFIFFFSHVTYYILTDSGVLKFVRKILKFPTVALFSILDAQGDTKKRELLKNPTKIEEIQEKKFIDIN